MASSVNNLSRFVGSSVMPGYVAPVVQDTNFKECLADITHFGELGAPALYLPTLSRIHTPTTIGQQWRADADSVGFDNNQLTFWYYTIHARYEYTDQQAAKMSKVLPAIGLQDLNTRLCEMAMNQRRHYGMWFGFDPTSTAQGIIAQGTTYTFVNDSDAHSTLLTYNPPELVALLAAVARETMNATYGMAKPVVIASSPRTINYIMSTIVAVTESQLPGAGIDSVGGTFGRVVGDWLGVGKVKFIQDKLLEGTGGTALTDPVVFIAPGLSEADPVPADISQYSLMDNNINRINTFMDNAGGLLRMENPIINWTHQGLFKLQTTPGAVVRKEAVRVINIPYSAS
jgi:hypothetical protein